MKHAKEHTPFSKSLRWFNHFQCWDAFQCVKMTWEAAVADYVSSKRIHYSLENSECRKCYTPKELINIEGSGFFWKHMLRHTFSSMERKQCLDLQLSKFANMILLGISTGRTFYKVVHITYM
jgi:hypothetical protein